MNLLERASLLLKDLFDKQPEDFTSANKEQPDTMTATSDTAADKDHEGQIPDPSLPALSPDDIKFVQNLSATILRYLSDANLDVEMLAREMAMSHTIFYERVRHVVGITPCNLIKKARMERAHELLSTTNSSVADVADQCGFSNWRYFSTVYKKYWGISPSKVSKVK